MTTHQKLLAEEARIAGVRDATAKTSADAQETRAWCERERDKLMAERKELEAQRLAFKRETVQLTETAMVVQKQSENFRHVHEAIEAERRGLEKDLEEVRETRARNEKERKELTAATVDLEHKRAAFEAERLEIAKERRELAQERGRVMRQREVRVGEEDARPLRDRGNENEHGEDAAYRHHQNYNYNGTLSPARSGHSAPASAATHHYATSGSGNHKFLDYAASMELARISQEREKALRSIRSQFRGGNGSSAPVPALGVNEALDKQQRFLLDARVALLDNSLSLSTQRTPHGYSAGAGAGLYTTHFSGPSSRGIGNGFGGSGGGGGDGGRGGNAGGGNGSGSMGHGDRSAGDSASGTAPRDSAPLLSLMSTRVLGSSFDETAGPGGANMSSATSNRSPAAAFNTLNSLGATSLMPTPSKFDDFSNTTTGTDH